MKHQEIIEKLVALSNLDEKTISALAKALPNAWADLLSNGGDVVIPGFGVFEVHKRLERIVENPATGRRTLTPPQLLLRFRQAIPSNSRFTLHDLVRPLSRKSKESEETALQFTAQCFGVINEALQADGFASLVGFGTFRLSQSPHDVSLLIEFVAEETLSQLINRPFAELPEVELSEATDMHEFDAIDETYRNKEEQQTPNPLDSSLETINTTQQADTKETEPSSEMPDANEPSVLTPETESDQPNPISTAEEMEEDHEAPTATETNTSADELQTTESEEEGGQKVYWKRAAIVFAIAFVALLLFVLLRVGRTEISDPNPLYITDTITASTPIKPAPKPVEQADTARVQIIPVNNSNEIFTQFEPDGVLDEHTIVYGDVLERLARNYYGNGYFVKYIIEYNNLPASGEVPIGTVIKIPHLRRKAAQ
ncbi:MAG: HU family DNA-binding protein [Bacteroidaceae bacterium]|nr:HU family DNA-binding protein [Bacteroidaceae bacterium]